MNKFKIFNDPIYGFIKIPSELIFDLIEHPYFQRLRRISQMGLSYLIYPGAHHTRFEHAVGAMHLMQEAISTLRYKKVDISPEEAEALSVAILLHDIGHGPFSHTLEQSIAKGIKHEDISLLFMERLNVEFEGKLSLAIKMFKGLYERKFFNQLISSQLDIDRLDYLKRDSFYTGVTEGNINVNRIISMLNVVHDELVVEEKGIYSVEKFIVARRLMYWLVYLHKTGIVADHLLNRTFKKAAELSKQGTELACSQPLAYFLNKKEISFNEEDLTQFAEIDDFDIISGLKKWKNSDDQELSDLSHALLDRKFPKIKFSNKKPKQAVLKQIAAANKDKKHLLFSGQIAHQAYDLIRLPIRILNKRGVVEDITQFSEHLKLVTLTEPVIKYFVISPND